ncbi:UDP-N-acetylmuramoylalanine--D-glutamate ligase [Chlamydiales bacterium SCGC AG-110-P3]|nr:UDP-N-acetylmuramoylalanine--D-glutamate ligase [Chlamydiales bacterium SCGC AG-110-P3]
MDSLTGLSGQRVLVVGLGVSGRASVDLLISDGALVTGYDDRTDKTSMSMLTEYDYLVVSPGIAPDHLLYNGALQMGIPVIGEAELAMRCLAGRRAVGITGTNGKTTVTLLTEHFLRGAGYPAVPMGNVGTPFSEIYRQRADAVIVGEFSSFQLETLAAPCLDAAVVLNITPDHLDRYRDLDHYAEAKLHIGLCLRRSGVLYLHETVFEKYGDIVQGVAVKTIGWDRKCDVTVVRDAVVIDGIEEARLPDLLRGKSGHEVTNYLAAYVLARSITGSNTRRYNLSDFSMPPHRLQYVTTINGIDYYDDSKGTNLDAVIHAVNSLHQPIVLLAGGKHKGASYGSWIECFAGKVKHVVAFGEAAQAVVSDLAGMCAVSRVETLDQAVSVARKYAREGDAVLLSPGCSSFDQFRDYVARGEHFQQVVKGLC